MITLVGVGHVFQLRQAIQAIIGSRQPDAVCIELDKDRYRALLDERRGRSSSLFYRLLARFQDRLAESYGSSVGDEMLAAVDAAKEVGAKPFLIDMDSNVVFRRIWKEPTMSEKAKLFLSAFTALFVTRKRVEKELALFEEDQEGYMEELGRQLPTVKRILIDDRDEHMSRALADLAKAFPRIVAVVGDGHVPGISRRLHAMEVGHESIRLADLRQGDLLRDLEREIEAPGST